MRGYFTRNSGLGGKDVRAITWQLEGEKRERAGRKLRRKRIVIFQVMPSFPSFTPCLAGRIFITLSLFFLFLHPPPRVRPPAYTRVCRGKEVKKGKEGVRGGVLIVHPVREVR